MTIDLGTHTESTSMVAMATSNNPHVILIIVYFLTTVMCKSIKLCTNVSLLYGCHGNNVTMATVKNMFETRRKWPQIIHRMCSPPLPQSSMVAMATLNNPL